MRTFLLAIVLFTVNSVVLAQPLVVTSIKPLQLIAAEIMQAVGEPVLVLDSSQDPHHPALKPSQRRAMDQADVFLWIGAPLETGLDRVVSELDADVITVLELSGLTLRSINNQVDPHAWLDTRNAGVIAAALTRSLASADADNAGRYQANLASFLSKLDTLDNAINNTLGAGSFPAYAVYHDGYRYFETQFGLEHTTSFTGNEEIQPGIRQILAIKSLLDENNVSCIVVNPEVNTARLDSQLDRAGVQYVVVDVLAHGIPASVGGYDLFMQGLANGFASCRQ